jgi:hypothetical protein
MRTARLFILLIAIMAFLTTSASAEVRITLKNGRSFIADFCRGTNGKFVCDMQGGTMEIERNDIANIKDVKVQKNMTREEAPEAEAQAEEKKQPETPAAEKKATPAQNDEGKLIRGLTPEQIKRLDEINERKAVLKPERERLIRERDQLHDDVKNAGVVRTQEQIDAIAKRVTDLEARINGFNDEVKRLNEEENALISGSGKQ